MSYPKAHPGPSQISNLDLFARKANGLKLILSTIIVKTLKGYMFEGVLQISDWKFTAPE